MLMPKAHRIKIYEFLFKEGVMVAKKDFNAPKHPDLESVPNLHVIKAMQSLKSKGLVKEQFAWRHYYWSLTNEGIQYLRDVLNLPPEIVPSTLKRQVRSETTRPRGTRGPDDRPKTTSDREAYRHAPGATDKQADVGVGEGKIDFKQGFGRGRPAQQ
ncbi:hypothetical protein JTE90_025171 [Oedothorax gibbosus]|uniref:Plectin/eS10 N-terminal domain-containing protein n=1 Tax=Oedothorax gibbosus TaxID=931172 RepID=A0AAV6UHJ7_9ARAC|nr:hypothetical protein JTE90_025171 [Oedothorax gibbosus]